MQSTAAVRDEQIIGYTVAYERDEIHVPVYIVIAIAVAFVAAGIMNSIPLLTALGFVPAAYAFYNYPLLETGRPRLGAGQYGLFVEGLGLVAWRAIRSIEIDLTLTRGVTGQDLVIALNGRVSQALIADWRQRTLVRRFMRLPWRLKPGPVIRIPLDIMDRPAGEIHQTFLRMWKYYGAQ